MVINDRIYGRIEINDPVIAALINSKPMQRLKQVSQYGAPNYIYPQINYSRFEHGVGTWYLSHKFNRPIGEQIAALLHDVPHTAFSHVIDFVMKDENHEYHDRFINKIIMESEIPDILQKHGVALNDVLEKSDYVMLDNKLPDVSVDRWDYFMRDGYVYGVLPLQTIQLFLDSIKERDQKFYFEDVRVAGQFAVMFMNMSRLWWLGPTAHGSFFLLAEAIKLSLERGVISEDDIFQTDELVMTKMRAAKDSGIDRLLDRLQPGKGFRYAPKDEAEFYGPNKPRFVDPWVESNGKLTHLSEVVPEMREYFDEFAQSHKYLGVVQTA